MPKHKVSEGDIVAVPLSDGSEALCRVLYKSGYFKKVILLACYGRWSHNSDAVTQTADPIIGQFYCGCQSIENGTWRYLANGTVSLTERQQSKRIVGGDVWLADECLGPDDFEHRALDENGIHTGNAFLSKKSNASCMANRVKTSF